MKNVLTRIVIVGVVLMTCSHGLAAGTTVAAAEPGAKSAEFERLFADWKALLSELRQLKKEYRTATSDRQVEIKAQYNRLIEKGDSLEPQLVEAAMRAFGEAPGEDKELVDFLLNIAVWKQQSDDHESLLPLAELLAKNQVHAAPMYDAAGVAAAATGQLELAEKYLQLAAKQGHQSELGAQFLENLAYYKEIWPKEQEIRAAEAKADDLPRVLIKTNKGDIEIELFENEAPNTVANFVSLVEKGFYDGLTFHRVLAGFMAQGGCPEGTGAGGPGYHIPCECYQPNHRLHFRGTLSMAHAGRDTGGSQFFITFVPTRHLDGKHTAFGRVIAGIDVLAKIQRRDPDDPNAPVPDKIIEAKVLRKRDHAYEPKKVEP